MGQKTPKGQEKPVKQTKQQSATPKAPAKQKKGGK